MKVLHVVNISFVLPYYIGGQFDFFQKKGVLYSVACTPSDFLFEYAKEKNFQAFGINILREFNIKEDLKAIRDLYKIIKHEKFDLVVCHTPKGALIGLIAAYLSRTKKRIYFRHGIMYETSRGLKRIVLKMIEKFSGALATQVVCVSNSILKISSTEKLSATRKNLILNKGTCNGIDTEKKFNPLFYSESDSNLLRQKLGIGENTKVLGFVGRIVKDKGIQELIDAWSLIKEQVDDVKLLIIGPYEDRDSISEQTKAAIEQDPTILDLGLIEDITQYYCLMDIFILPSYREGFPTVVLEASSMGLPVLTTRATGCIDSIIPDETGLFISCDKNEILEKVQLYFENPSLAKKHGKKGREWVRNNFRQELIWKEIDSKIVQANI